MRLLAGHVDARAWLGVQRPATARGSKRKPRAMSTSYACSSAPGGWSNDALTASVDGEPLDFGRRRIDLGGRWSAVAGAAAASATTSATVVRRRLRIGATLPPDYRPRKPRRRFGLTAARRSASSNPAGSERPVAYR